MTIPILVELLPPPVSAHVLPLSENPLLDDWLKAVEDYRSEVDAASGSLQPNGGVQSPPPLPAGERWAWLVARMASQSRNHPSPPRRVVVTRNRRDFGRVTGLAIEDWSV